MDNQAALKKLGGESSSKAKHIDLRIKFVGLHAKCGTLKTEYCEGSRIPDDMMTKAFHAPEVGRVEKSYRFTLKCEIHVRQKGAHVDGLNGNAHNGGVLKIVIR